jgi:hypothetical protein
MEIRGVAIHRFEVSLIRLFNFYSVGEGLAVCSLDMEVEFILISHITDGEFKTVYTYGLIQQYGVGIVGEATGRDRERVSKGLDIPFQLVFGVHPVHVWAIQTGATGKDNACQYHDQGSGSERLLLA